MSVSKWEQLYQILKDRIQQGVYKPGQEFPTNLELIREFGYHNTTVQAAVNALIRDGLIFSSGKRNIRRTVRDVPHRSKRKGGFTADSGAKKSRKELLELKIITEEKELPEEVLKEMKLPVLYYHHNQWLENTLVAVSKSYIPHLIPLVELEKKLNEKGAKLYKSMEALGFQPTMVEESLIAGPSSEEDNQALQLPKNSSLTVVHITRKVMDDDDRLLEYCFLTDRADCYEFSYRFPMY